MDSLVNVKWDENEEVVNSEEVEFTLGEGEEEAFEGIEEGESTDEFKEVEYGDSEQEAVEIDSEYDTDESYDEFPTEQVSDVASDIDREELKRKAEELKVEMESPDVISSVGFSMLNNEGDYIEPRVKGGISLKMLNIETDIQRTRRVRISPQDIFSLQEQIRKFGQLQPIHVVKFGDRYLLLDGYRRLQACVNIGQTEVLAYVDETIPSEMVKYFEPMVNGVAPYTFTEKIEYGKFFKETQPNVGYDIIEGILGLRTGEFLKGLYIDTMKPEFQETYQQVEKAKLTIEQGFKKIEKEIEKQEKENSGALDDLNSGALDDKLRNTDELAEMQLNIKQQELGDRKILDPVLRRSVESRDGGFCQCCGYGKGEPDFMGVFKVHHIVAVQYGGKDTQSNLILLCNNCHALVHDYETGRFLPEQDTYNRRSDVKRIVVLGNILTTTRKRAIAEIRRKHVEVGRQMDAGKLTIGQAIQKVSLDVKGEEYFNNSPYKTFMDSTKDLEYGGRVTGELGVVSWEDENEVVEEIEVELEQQEEKSTQ